MVILTKEDYINILTALKRINNPTVEVDNIITKVNDLILYMNLVEKYS